MRIFVRASIAVTAAALLVGASAMSASAATGDSTATATVTGGALSISVPASVTLTSTGPGVAATGTYGDVQVDDARASTSGWTASIAVTDFTSTSPSSTIEASNFSYTPGTAVKGGAGAATLASSGQVSGQATPQDVVTATGVSGNNTATWTPTVSLTVPANALAATYTATLTHSVL